MTNVLIVMATLGMGGAEKSLISFLNTIDREYLEQEDISIDLLTAEIESPLAKDIPEYIHVIPCPLDFKIYALAKFQALQYIPQKRTVNFIKLFFKINSLFCRKKISENEKYWFANKKFLKPIKKEYDVCLAYMNGTTTYFSIEKVKAKKKVVWVHNDYKALNYTDWFQRQFFDKADQIVTISDICAKSLKDTFPDLSGKVTVIENISSVAQIRRKADAFIPEEYAEEKRVKIVSIGRLNHQKGFDIGIQTVSVLKNRGLDVCWYIIGEGELKEELERQIIAHGVDGSVKLLGRKSNPYPYIKNADIFFQPSRYEGKSITLDEAKILCKPIVVAAYQTVGDSIINEINGIIADIEPDSLAVAIQKIVYDNELRVCLVRFLSENGETSEKKIVKYYDLFTNGVSKIGKGHY